MKLVGADDLTKRIGPRLDKFHSVDTTGLYKGVVYWRKTFLYPGHFLFLSVFKLLGIAKGSRLKWVLIPTKKVIFGMKTMLFLCVA